MGATAAGGQASGDTATVTAYDGAGNLTVGPGLGGIPVATDTYVLYNPDTLPVLKASTRFLSTTTITIGLLDVLNFRIVGTSASLGCITASLSTVPLATPGVFTSATVLAAELQDLMNAQLVAGAAIPALAPQVLVTADSDGRLNFQVIPDAVDFGGAYLEFVTDLTPAQDFAILAGLDTAGPGGTQTRLYNGPIASTFEFTGATTTDRVYDRLFLQNRIRPGDGSDMDTQFVLDQCQLKVMGGTGLAQAALTANEEGQRLSGRPSCLRPPSEKLVSRAGRT